MESIEVCGLTASSLSCQTKKNGCNGALQSLDGSSAIRARVSAESKSVKQQSLTRQFMCGEQVTAGTMGPVSEPPTHPTPTHPTPTPFTALETKQDTTSLIETHTQIIEQSWFFFLQTATCNHKKIFCVWPPSHIHSLAHSNPHLSQLKVVSRFTFLDT